MNIRMFPQSVIKHFSAASSDVFPLRHRTFSRCVIGRFPAASSDGFTIHYQKPRPLFPLRKKSISNKFIYIIIYIITLYALFVKFRLPFIRFHTPLP